MKPLPEKSPQEVLAGLIERVTYHNSENGFCVLRAKVRGHRDVVTVVGHAAAIAAVVSAALYLPAYAYLARTRILQAPPSDLALQAIVQGFLTGIVALLLYGRMVAILGASGGAASHGGSDSRRVAIADRLHGRRVHLDRRVRRQRRSAAGARNVDNPRANAELRPGKDS